MKIYRRTLVSELSNSVGSAFTVLFSIVLTIGLVRILNQTAGGRYGSDSILEVVAYSSLTNLPPLIALALFLGVLITLMRYWQDNEMVVWFSSGGLSLTSWIRPVLRLSIPVVLLVAACSIAISPWSRSQMTAYRDRFAAREDVTKISPGQFIEAQKGRRIFFLESMDQATGKVSDIFILQHGADGKESIVAAEKGRLHYEPNGDRYITLDEGQRYEVPKGGKNIQIMDFGSYSMRVDSSPITPTEISKVNSLPFNLLLTKKTSAATAEIFWRLSWPLIALNLALLAIPLSYNNPRVGRSFGLVIAVLIFILYLNSLSIFQTWIIQEKLGLVSSLILMNLPVALLTIVMFYRLMTMNTWRLGTRIRRAITYPIRKLRGEKS